MERSIGVSFTHENCTWSSIINEEVLAAANGDLHLAALMVIYNLSIGALVEWDSCTITDQNTFDLTATDFDTIATFTPPVEG